MTNHFGNGCKRLSGRLTSPATRPAGRPGYLGMRGRCARVLSDAEVTRLREAIDRLLELHRNDGDAEQKRQCLEVAFEVLWKGVAQRVSNRFGTLSWPDREEIAAAAIDQIFRRFLKPARLAKVRVSPSLLYFNFQISSAFKSWRQARQAFVTASEEAIEGLPRSRRRSDDAARDLRLDIELRLSGHPELLGLYRRLVGGWTEKELRAEVGMNYRLYNLRKNQMAERIRACVA